MSVTIYKSGVGGLIIITVVVGALVIHSPGMIQQWIDSALERPLVSAGFAVLFVFLVLFGNGPPGDDGTG